MSCISCGRGFINECTCESATEEKPQANSENEDWSGAGYENDEPKRGPGRPQKDPSEMLDPKSTGRKRAAQLYPLDPNAWCEWLNKANCGGGKHPILGCSSGKQRNIHHGPDKDTNNNHRSNIHLICPDCHNRWHAANDNDHDATISHAPYDASPFERQQRLNEEMLKELKKEKK